MSLRASTSGGLSHVVKRAPPKCNTEILILALIVFHSMRQPERSGAGCVRSTRSSLGHFAHNSQCVSAHQRFEGVRWAER